MTLKITNKQESTREENINHLVWAFSDVVMHAHSNIKENSTALGVYDEKDTKTIKGEDWASVVAIWSEVNYMFKNNDLLHLLLNRLTDEELQQLALHRDISDLKISKESE
jgi:hypothetical protein